MKKLEKVLALLLSVTMIITSLTVTSFAATANTWVSVSGQSSTSTSTIYTYYKNGFTKDVTYLQLSSSTWTMAAEPFNKLIIPAGKTVYLDLNGKQFYSNGSRNLIENNGTLIIMNSGSRTAGSLRTLSGYNTILNKGTLYMSNCTVGVGTSSAWVTNNATNAINNSGTAAKAYVENCIIRGGITKTSGSTFEMHSGDITYSTGNLSSGYSCVQNSTVLSGGYTVQQKSGAVNTVEALVGTTSLGKFTSLEIARTAAMPQVREGQTVTFKLLQDISLSKHLIFSLDTATSPSNSDLLFKDVHLDLNGHKITAAAGCTSFVGSDGTNYHTLFVTNKNSDFTIEDSSSDKTGVIDFSAATDIYQLVLSSGSGGRTAHYNGGTFIGHANGKTFQAGNKAEINDGTFINVTVTNTTNATNTIVNGGWFSKAFVSGNRKSIPSGRYETGACADAPNPDAPYTVADKATYTVSFDDGTTAIEENHGTKVTLPEGVTSDGEKFIGWTKTPGSVEAEYEVGEELEFSKDILLYPVVSGKAESTVKFFDGDTELTDLAIKTFQEATVTLPNGSDRDDLFFDSWNTKADGSGDSYSAGEKYKVEDIDPSLYAQYEKAEAAVIAGGETTYYKTLEETCTPAINATPKDGDKATIKLNKDVYIENTLNYGGDTTIKRILTFDLNGYTLETGVINKNGGNWWNNGILRNNPYSTMYITDSSSEQTGQVKMAKGSESYVLSRDWAGTQLIIQGGTWTGAGAIAHYDNGAASENRLYVTVEAGSFDVNPYSETAGKNYVADGFEVEEDGGMYKVVPKKNISVKVDGKTTYYRLFNDAWTAANASGKTTEIKLLADCDWGGVKPSMQANKITLDLNGFTVTEDTERLFSVAQGKEFDIIDSSKEGKGQLIDTATAAGKNGAIIVYGTLKALGGTIKTTATEAGAWYQEDVISAYNYSPTIIIDGATITNSCDAKPAIGVHSGTVNFVSGTVNGGILNFGDTYEVTGNVVATTQSEESTNVTYHTSLQDACNNAVAITPVAENEATLKVIKDTYIDNTLNMGGDSQVARVITFDLNGHTITTGIIKGEGGWWNNGFLRNNPYAKTYIIDSSLEKTGRVDMKEGSEVYVLSRNWAGTKIYIEGGTWTGAKGIAHYPNGTTADTQYCLVHGGTFDVDPSKEGRNYVPTDYYAYENTNDTWTVREKTYSVTIGGKTTRYPFIGEAVDAIVNSSLKEGTIVPNGDITLDEAIYIDDADANITLDLGGHKAIPAEGKSFANVEAGTFIIKNGEIDFTGCGEEAYITLGKNNTLALEDVTLTGSEVFIKSKGVVFIDDVVTITGVVFQEESAVSFHTINASIADDIKFTVVINAALIEAEAGANVQLQYTVDERINGVASRKTVVADALIENGQHVFEFEEGIPQWSVDSDLEFKVLIDGEVRAEKSYTLQDYYNALNKTYPDDTLLNTLMANQMKFAEQLQKEAFGSSTIEYTGWEEEFISVVVPSEADNVKKTVDSTGYKKGVSQIAAATVNVTDRIALTYKAYSETDNSSLTVVNEDGKEVEISNGTVRNSTPENPWYVYQSKVSPLDYDEKYTVTLRNEKGDIIHAVTYSVNSYCYSINNGSASSKAKETALALYRYGIAAAQYAEETSPNAKHHFGLPTYSWSPYYKQNTATRKCTDPGCKVVQTETVDASRTDVYDAEETAAGAYLGEEYIMTAKFANPAFRMQTHYCTPDIRETNPDYVEDPRPAFEKHLITNSDGSYGGTLNKTSYGTGAPLNGALDKVDKNGNLSSIYYRANDFYNAGNSASRILIPKFSAYQQTMENSDGIACALMAMTYCGDKGLTELGLVQEFQKANGVTVYGHKNDVTPERLAQLFKNHGYTAEANCFTGSSTGDFKNWIQQNLANNKFILIRYQNSFMNHWRIIIGYDDGGTAATTVDDVVIMANPYDAFDHYQDGYSIEPVTYLYAWWFTVQLEDKVPATETRSAYFPEKNHKACVVVDAKQPFAFETPDVDILRGERMVPVRHELLNDDGSFGGTLDKDKYGGGNAVNAYSLNSTTQRRESQEHFDFGYYAFPDYYNMKSNSSTGKYILGGFNTHSQLMSSSCGINSTFLTMDYLGFDFNKIYPKLNAEQRSASTLDLSGNNEDGFSGARKEESFLRYFMQVNGIKRFNNFGGVDPSNLRHVPEDFGFEIVRYGNHNFPKCRCDTYNDFKTKAIEALSQGLPMVVCWTSTGGHYETIIGFDTMGTSDPYDDVVVLADSSDHGDHFIDGYNTFPAMWFYSRWFNGGRGLAQMQLVIKPIK